MHIYDIYGYFKTGFKQNKRVSKRYQNVIFVTCLFKQ